ncbi:MAG: sigma-70 family RNA polymerase sigma factor [Minicystis sp.]
MLDERIEAPVLESVRLPRRSVALEVAWSEHKPRLYRLCLRWVGGDPVDAEDALGQLALRAVEDDAAHAGAVANYGGWLTRLAWNLCMDMHRERSVRRRALEHFAEEGQLHVTLTESHPETIYSHRELGCRIQQAIDDLPPRLREPCRRRFVEEAEYEHIAEDLGLTNETVRKRIQEARDILCERLGIQLREDLLRAGLERRTGRFRRVRAAQPANLVEEPATDSDALGGALEMDELM